MSAKTKIALKELLLSRSGKLLAVPETVTSTGNGRRSQILVSRENDPNGEALSSKADGAIVPAATSETRDEGADREAVD
jgi:hypothetical protein